MTEKEFVIDAMRKQGRIVAQDVQNRAADMTGTELNAEDGYIPSFAAAIANKNMLERPAGFVCKSSAGRVVKLLQPYDSDIFTAEPEELPAQWGFVWSTDPAKAKPFIALATSPFNKGDCCSEDAVIYRSLVDGNVWPPSAYPAGWETVS